MIILRCGGTGVTANENDRDSKEEEKEKERRLHKFNQSFPHSSGMIIDH
jgi:hypothetical protein